MARGRHNDQGGGRGGGGGGGGRGGGGRGGRGRGHNRRGGRNEPDDDEMDSEEEEEEEDYHDDDDEGEDGEDDNADDDPMTHLPDYVIQRVEKLKDINRERECLMEEYIAERAALEAKYNAMFQPFYNERAEVIRGEKDDEIMAQALAANFLESPEDKVPAELIENNPAVENGNVVAVEPAEKVNGIPQFWVCAMTNNDTIGDLIAEDDVDCLESLRDITCEDRPDGKGFSLHFHFAPNPYFENEVLTKTYEVPNLLLYDEPLLKNVTGTTINWKEGKALTFRMIKKKQRGKGKHAGKVRTVTKKEDLESFFRWFEPPEMPPMDELDEEQAEQLEEIFDDDYEVANAFRCAIIPHAVLWFTGEADDEHIFSALEQEGIQEVDEGE